MDEYLNETENFEVELAAKKEDQPQNEGYLTIDVFEENNNIVVQSTIAGADPEAIDITITKDMVTIKGKREPEQKINPSSYFHQELYWGAFSRAIILPVDVNSDNAKASFKNGVLTITMPKLDKVKIKK
jgi:HSP20 family protein